VAGWHEPGLIGEYDELGAVAQLVPVQHLADITLHCRLGEVQPGRDLPVAEALGDQPHHVRLPVGDGQQLRLARARLLEVGLDQAAGDARRQQRVAGGDRPDP
jgi:hypothetical protein